MIEATRKDRISEEAVEAVFDRYAHTHVDGQLLPELDVHMLTLTALQRDAEPGLLGHRVGEPLKFRDFSRCMLLGVDAMLRAKGESPADWFALMRLTCRVYATWMMGVRALFPRIRGNDETLSDGALLVAAAFAAAREGLGLHRDSQQWRWAARRALHGIEHHQNPDENEVDQNLRVFRSAVFPQSGGLFVSGDGRLLLGHRQVRDGLVRVLGLRRVSRRNPTMVPSSTMESKQGEAEDFMAEARDERLEDIVEQVDRAHQVEQLRDLVQARRGRARPGSVRAVALENYEAVRSGQMSLREVAQATGRGFSALHRAMEEIDAEISAKLARNPKK